MGTSYVTVDAFNEGMRELKTDLMEEVDVYRPLSVRVNLDGYQAGLLFALVFAIVFRLVTSAVKSILGD